MVPIYIREEKRREKKRKEKKRKGKERREKKGKENREKDERWNPPHFPGCVFAPQGHAASFASTVVKAE